MTYNMKKSFLPTLAIIIVGTTLMQGCHKEACPGGDPLPENPVLTSVTTSGCHTYTDALAAKDINTDSVAVAFSPDEGQMSVTHYNMPLDCGSGEHIVTTIDITYPASTRHPSQEGTGSTITVTEDVGEQGRTNCVCLYDNSFQIAYLPPRPFTLVVKVKAGSEQKTVYQQLFE